MKLTKSKLKEIIREEIRRLNEGKKEKVDGFIKFYEGSEGYGDDEVRIWFNVGGKLGKYFHETDIEGEITNLQQLAKQVAKDTGIKDLEVDWDESMGTDVWFMGSKKYLGSGDTNKILKNKIGNKKYKTKGWVLKD